MKYFASDRSGFTMIELMLVVIIISFLSATAIPAFQSYFIRAKTAEAPDALNKMVNGEIEYYHKNSTFLAAGPTNVPPGRGISVQVDFNADDNWKSLAFGMSQAVYFGYQADLISATQVNCEAMADLDANGATSLFRRTVRAANDTVTSTDVYVFDELE